MNLGGRFVEMLRTSSQDVRHTRNDVTSRLPDGGQQGYHPAAMRGRTPGTVAEEPHAPTVYPVIRRRGRIFQLQPDLHGAGEGFSPPESADTVWFGGSAGLAPDRQRYQVGRHTQDPTTGDATHVSRGSSPTRSGPEGTLVLYPPKLPRMMGTHRAVSGNTANRPAVQRVGTPQISVTQAAGWYP